MGVLTDLRDCGIRDVFFLVGRAEGATDVVTDVWPETTVQTCIVNPIRIAYRLALRRGWDGMKKHVQPIYAIVDANSATQRWEVPVQAGPNVTRLSSGHGATPGKSSFRSSTTTSRFTGSCPRPTASSR